MQNLGMVISVCAFLLVGTILLRGIAGKCLKMFPLYYSYMIYVFCGSAFMYLVYWLDRSSYPSAYWLYFLISILVEFAVLVEISDHIFKDLPALRNLGRAITIFISAALALVYILPVIFWSHGRPPALLGFALRASVTKVVVLAVLFIVARHYCSELGKNVAGLMLGFSIYLGVSIGNIAAANAFGIALYAKMLWIVSPAAYLLCLIVWTIALWDFVPAQNRSIVSRVGARDSQAVALELSRFNNELSKLLNK
jgi:hypothetical protein